jgi:hypothetical protein
MRKLIILLLLFVLFSSCYDDGGFTGISSKSIYQIETDLNSDSENNKKEPRKSRFKELMRNPDIRKIVEIIERG